MTQQPCPTCPTLRAQISRLEAENTRLRIKVKKLESEIVRLRNLIHWVYEYCESIAAAAQTQMSHHLARAAWSYCKGQYEIAAAVCNVLYGE